MRSLLQDIRFGARMLFKNPGLTVVAVLALALGIGANTTIFSCINALLLRPFAFPHAERAVMLWEAMPQSGITRGSVAPANFYDVRKENAVFDEMSVSSGWGANLTGGDRPERITGAAVSPQFFSLLGVEPSRGRTFAPEEERPGSTPVVVLSDGLWERRFGRDEAIVGKTIPINNRQFTVVGIMPRSFSYPRGGTEIWTPFVFEDEDIKDRDSHYLRVLARLKPGVTREQAASEMRVLAQRFAEAHPESNTGRQFILEGLVESETMGPRPYLLLLLGAVGFVLLIACANVANLLLLRGAARAKEMAIRTAMGASRGRIVRQLLTESVLLALLGGCTGLLLAVWAVDAIAASIPANFARMISGWENMHIDWRVFAFTLGVSLLTGIIFGLVPALQASKTDLNEALKEGGRRSGADSRSRLRGALVVSEVALSLVLLVGAGLVVKSFIALAHVNPGFDTARLLTMELTLPRLKYEQPEQRRQFFDAWQRNAEGIPGVASAGAISSVPLAWNNNSTFFRIEGRPAPPPGQELLSNLRVANPQYFGVIQIPLRQGRLIEARDTADAPPVAVVSAQMAEKFFPGETAVGKRITFGEEGKPTEIVGVVGDVRQEPFTDNMSNKPEPTIYLPYAQSPWNSMTLVVRAAPDGEATQLVAPVQSAVQSVDKDQPVYNVRTMGQIMSETIAPQRISSFMFAGFALIALLLSTVGIYAVISYSVAQRTHEIGVRMALGAQARDILRLVVGQGLKLIFAGVLLGLLGAFAVTRLMSSILFGVSTTDVLTFVGIPALLSAIALLACYIPARRAARVDPMVALRYE
jgi:putative ABC transport system permease protein